MENDSVLYQGNIITAEPRNVIDRFKSWYKEKVIDSGISQNVESGIDKTAKTVKDVIKVAGTAATVLLAICPADGPFGELCAAAATPGLCVLVDKIADLSKNIAIGAKREGEKIIGFEGQGNNPNVSGYTDLNQPVQDAISIRNIAEEILNNNEGELKR